MMRRRRYNIIEEMGSEVEGANTSIINVEEMVNNKSRKITDNVELELISLTKNNKEK